MTLCLWEAAAAKVRVVALVAIAAKNKMMAHLIDSRP
jgi:hypothetical protein